MIRLLTLCALVALPASSAEQAGYDSNGRIIALIAGGEDFEVASSVVAVLPNGRRIPIGIRRDEIGAIRQGDALAWSVPFSLPDGDRGRLELKSTEDPTGVHYAASITADSALTVSAIELVVDVPRPAFVNGQISAGAQPIALTSAKPPGPAIFTSDTNAFHFQSADRNIALDLGFDHMTQAAVIDRWDATGRSYQVRAAVRQGPWTSGSTAALTATLRLTDYTPQLPAHLSIDNSLYRFQGFGGNYCWDIRSPIAQYTLDNLKVAWARTEMKAIAWDSQHDQPGPELRADFELMRRLQQKGIHYVISVWSLPERFYTDAYMKPASAHARTVNPEKWSELIELLGSYLAYAKREYSVEPDLFSLNEANIGINIGLTADGHTDFIKRAGSHFRSLGLKTKLVLGDVASPRDTHRFALDAASDPEALQYIGAVAFHSWGGGTPDQYRSWAELAEWLNLPLLVTEVGVDPSAYYTHSWDSYDYGLREARIIQDLLTHAHPQGMQFWQFTNDYALTRVTSDGKVEPTSRFWLIKHFSDLTPQNSDALSASSDQPNVMITAFRENSAITLHILNVGAAREIGLNGIPDAEWQQIETTEDRQYQSKPLLHSSAHALKLNVPGRSLTTLVSK